MRSTPVGRRRGKQEWPEKGAELECRPKDSFGLPYRGP